jgi:TPR repeat protein
MIEPFQAIPYPEGSRARQDACSWYHASQQIYPLKKMSLKAFLLEKDNAKQDQNGPLLYQIGRILETGYGKIKANRRVARETYLMSFNYHDPRSAARALGCNSMGNRDKLEVTRNDCSLDLAKVAKIIGFASEAGDDEGVIFAKLSHHYHQGDEVKKREQQGLYRYFLYCAALFGHVPSQTEWAKHQCPSQTDVLFWNMQIAETDSLDALGMSGHFLERGIGCVKDYDRAYHYLWRAAHHPEATAEDYANLSTMYFDGKGTTLDIEEGLKWLDKALQLNPNEPQYIFQYGKELRDMGRDLEALNYFEQSQNLSNQALFEYAACLRRISQQLDKEIPEQAIKIFTRLAYEGHGPSMEAVSLFMQTNVITEEKEISRFKIFLEKVISDESFGAVQQSQAYYILAGLYHQFYENEKVTRSKVDLLEAGVRLSPGYSDMESFYARELQKAGRYKEALKVYMALHEKNPDFALNEMGVCYEDMAQTETKAKRKKRLYKKAADCYLKQVQLADHSHTPVSAFNIYGLYFQGHFPYKLETQEVLTYLKMAAHSGDREALNDLGIVYAFSILKGIEPDQEKGEDYLRQAMEKGCVEAKFNLAVLKIDEKEQNENFDESKKLFSELLEEDPERMKPLIDDILNAMKEGEKKEVVYNKGEKLEKDEPLASHEGKEKELELEEDSPSKLNIFGSRKDPVLPVYLPSSRGDQKSVLRQKKGDDSSLVWAGEKNLNEQERYQKKVERLFAKLSSAKGKRTSKFRKIKGLLSQHIHLQGGHIKAGGRVGSGRRLKIGEDITGFHQPHMADMRGKSLTNILKFMESTLEKEEKGKEK